MADASGLVSGAPPFSYDAREATSVGTTVWARLRRHRLALIGSVVLITLVVICVLAPEIFPLKPYAVDLRSYQNPPSVAHWLGTDSSGRDVLSRLIFDGRVSLSVGIYIALGLFFGSISGYRGGWVDSLIMRLADTVLAFPRL